MEALFLLKKKQLSISQISMLDAHTEMRSPLSLSLKSTLKNSTRNVLIAATANNQTGCACLSEASVQWEVSTSTGSCNEQTLSFVAIKKILVMGASDPRVQPPNEQFQCHNQISASQVTGSGAGEESCWCSCCED